VTGGTAPAGGNHDTGYYLFAGVLVIASLGVVGWGLFRKK
jgi:hypothetical protein